MADFILRALLAGLCVSLLTGPLGCFVVWRRMSYFGDTLAHSALLGIAFGLLLDIHLQLAVILACSVLALLLVVMESNKSLATDTILGILAHCALALGIVVLSFSDQVQIDLMAYLFGDLLTVTRDELFWLLGGGALVLLTLLLYWKRLLTITLHEELAAVEGLNVKRLRLILMLLIAVVVAVAMKIIGILLITSLMIIPAAAARNFSRTPEQMALTASLIGCLSVCIGLGGSWLWDTPSGPSIVVAAGAVFLLINLRRHTGAQ